MKKCGNGVFKVLMSALPPGEPLPVCVHAASGPASQRLEAADVTPWLTRSAPAPDVAALHAFVNHYEIQEVRECARTHAHAQVPHRLECRGKGEVRSQIARRAAWLHHRSLAAKCACAY
ncbi:hypothetical protein EON67_06350 [archaeon]|nr:MAG: hypothetical protein EON67_06350 [archaeon]